MSDYRLIKLNRKTLLGWEKRWMRESRYTDQWKQSILHQLIPKDHQRRVISH